MQSAILPKTPQTANTHAMQGSTLPKTPHTPAAPRVPPRGPTHRPTAYVTDTRETYLGEKFTQSWPQQAQDSSAGNGAAPSSPPPITLQYNHTALPVRDVAALTRVRAILGMYESERRFYTEVLGMERVARPGFPFDGAWLVAGGFFLHLIEKDPTVPEKTVATNVESGAPGEREPWYIRRGRHTAFEVSSLADTKARLEHFGVPYDQFIVPGTDAAQIFLYDPEWNGVELGEAYKEVAEHLKRKTGVKE